MVRIELYQQGIPSAASYTDTDGRFRFPNVYSGSWVGFFAPAKTPDAVIAKLNREINAIVRQDEAQQRLKTIGFEAIFKTPVEAADYFKAEVANWGKMVRAIGVTVD